VTGVVDDNDSWVGEHRRYHRHYDAPIVLGQVQSEVNEDWSVFWSKGSSDRTAAPTTTTLRTGIHVGEDPNTYRDAETSGVIVIEAGHGTVGGVAFEAGLTGASIAGAKNTDPGPPFTGLFASPFTTAPQVAIVTQAGMQDPDGSWAMLYGPTFAYDLGLYLAVDEDMKADAERVHAAERVSYLAFESPVVYPPASYGNGDFDEDGDVDLADYRGMQQCIGLPGVGPCAAGNLAGNGWVNETDLQPFVELISGP
jgi:hypothetical protein